MIIVNMTIKEKINKVLEIQKKQDIRDTEIAYLLGISFSTWRNYKIGKTIPYNSAIIEKIDRFININS
jgi:hypothetical protein